MAPIAIHNHDACAVLAMPTRRNQVLNKFAPARECPPREGFTVSKSRRVHRNYSSLTTPDGAPLCSTLSY
jgi:hypothetical protein